MTDIEEKTFSIDNLPNNIQMDLFPKSVLYEHGNTETTMRPLEYLLKFLDAYDFSSEGSEDIQEENKPLISASVLGLIFEKINGYKDGSFFTPSFITMYMCRETISRAVIQKFNEMKGWNCQTIDQLYNKIENTEEANTIFNSIRICDPAVGSGHFLVSALNEMIYLKSKLGILCYKDTERKLKEYRVTVENDELLITDNEGNYFHYNPKNEESQRVQESFFHEKQTIIENCLFGVDINPNSVKICQLRLWIELLKHTYYRYKTTELVTLPNIDINIKCGNSLLSRYDLKDQYHDVQGMMQKIKNAARKYKEQVFLYKLCKGRENKRQIIKNIEHEKSIIYEIFNAKDSDFRKWENAKAELAVHTYSIPYEDDKEVWNKKIEQLKAEESAFREKYELKKASYTNAFEWRFEFPEVLDEDGNFVGFDVVIGNPPYGVKLEKSLINFLSKKHNLAIPIADTYLMFTKMAYSISKPNSIISYIIPSTWLYMSQYKDFRQELLNQVTIQEIQLFRKFVFEQAVVETCTFLSKNIPPTPDTNYSFKEIKTEFDFKNVLSLSRNQLDLAKGEYCSLILSNNNEDELFDKIMKNKSSFESIALIVCGLTPYRVGKGIPPQTEEITKERGFDADFKKDETYRQYLMGRDFNRYSWCIEKERWISYGHWLAEPRYKAPFEDEKKIIIRQTSDKLIAHLDTKKFLSLKNVHNVRITNPNFSYEYILALLNSKLLDWWYQKLIPEKGRVFAEVKVVNLEQLPICPISSTQQKPIVNLVNQILSAKKENPAPDTAELEREIDLLVYGLYGLKEEEIEIIEK